MRVFVTYNPNEPAAQNTALRLQTISSLYGYATDLPARLYSQASISEETKVRISGAGIVLALATGRLSKQMKAEVEYAMGLGKPLILVHDSRAGKSVYASNANIKEIYIDYGNPDEAIKQVSAFLHGLSGAKKKEPSITDKEASAVAALAAVGLGLLAMWALSKDWNSQHAAI